MENNSQLTTTNKILFYKTRKFWITLLTTQVIINIFLFSGVLNDAGNITEFILTLLGISGAVAPGIIIGIFFSGMLSKYLTAVVFVLILSLLARYLIRNKTINPTYPSLFFLMSLISSMTLFTFLSVL